MDNLGRSLDNLHIGNTEIVKGNNEEGDLTIEGDLICQGDVAFDNVIMNDLKVVNSLEIDGYTMPTAAGTDGQVLTMNADNKTTSFKDITGGVSRVWTNLYSMITPNDAPSTAVLNIDSQGIGTKTISTSDFSIGSSLRFIAEGQYKFRLNDAADLLKLETDFQILGDFGVHNIKLWEFVLNNPPSPAAGIGTFIENVGYFKLHFYITRIDATTLKLGSVSLQAYPIINALNDAQIIEINSPLQNPAIATPANYTILNSGNLNFNIKSYNLFSYFSGSTAALNTQIYTIDFCNADQSVLATSATLSGSHLLLSNLNAAGPSGFLDGGHDLMLLSDGSKSMTGGLDMNSNQIINCSSLNNSTGLNIDSGGNDLNLNTTTNIIFNATALISNGILSMSDNAIINCSSVQDNDRIDLISNLSDIRILCGQLFPPISPIIIADFNYNRTEINNNLNVPSINNLSPVGGVSAGIVDGTNITGTTEQSLLPVSFVGSRQVPPNTFKVGDSYTATLAGDFGSANGDQLTIRLKGGPAGSTLLSTLIVPLVNSNSTFFECEIDFCVRAIGITGEMAINYDFSYNQAGGGGAWQGERKCEKFVFDTTILNQLDITAQFSSANAANNIQTLFSTLSKTY